MGFRIGVDVGGTNTDAAILDTTPALIDQPSRGVCASSKTPTTADVTSGIYTAIVDVLAKAQVPRHDVRSVAIGTTHFVNAVVEADPRRLSRVAVIRLCGPYTRAIPPFFDFPPHLRDIVGGPVYYLDGGLEIDGREISPISPKQIEDTVREIETAGITTVAIVGVFSPLDHQGVHEETCKKMILQQNPGLSVVCSADIGSVGLLERENATILNASILALAKKTIRAFCQAMQDLQLDCPLYLTQNDGTLTSAATAAERPIQTFASGPTNSLTGAAYLAGLDRRSINADTQVLVMDIGGTTSDVCALLPSGFPRKAPNFVEVGGVRTAFPIPEVLSVGLGGGSRIRVDAADSVTVGPDSVGYRLTKDALVFGGDVMTTTDIVVASGKADLGDASKVQHIPAVVLAKARASMKKILERAIDDMKVSDQPVTLLLVGGGSIVCIDALEGVAECILPPHHDSANAVGAAIAKVSGEVDIIEILEGRDERAVVEAAKQQAVEAAIARGADKDDVTVVEVDKIPLQYVTNKAIRLVVKAVGKLAAPVAGTPTDGHPVSWISTVDEPPSEPPAATVASAPPSLLSTKHIASLDIETYVPEVTDNVWYLSAVDLEFIATGTGVLGTGGGGPSYLQYLQCLDWLQGSAKGRMRVISADSVSDTDVCVFGSWYGAPSVYGERIPAKTELTTAIDHAVRLSGHSHFEVIIADEIGGGNGMSTFPTSAYYDIPVLDGDLMGRAYPSMEHGMIPPLDAARTDVVVGTPYVYGHPITPCVIADAKGNVGVVLEAESNRRVEELLRSQCVNLGISTAVAAVPLTCDIVKKYCIPNTVSQAWYLGRAIHRARRSKTDVVKAIFETTPGKLLYSGKIIDVKRDVSRGYTMGQCTIAPLSGEEREESDCNAAETRHLMIPFQNEFLYAAYIDPTNPEASNEVICTVPDLISVLGQDGEAIGSQELRYGLRVNVIGIAAHPLWTGDERGLRVGGPKGFGLDMEWTSLGPYQASRSVIAEFNR
ncbi:hydantoinase/oxoprolinase [Aspergillus sclerotioniger CBS 115572]|uniref:Hydantoinase/oxoprolinase n=1 Tax=Aspergillus sclerotioniger CBS 115572 TaxID=1450535 RepID=A0A317XC04_9EURO|nr:hydantoinase/oxoprolinase [Aspergillus sclerotioniger CBS 115572]PWY96126.1 hydantoinase/oxoprolinase [Aspergillus sclerotioniger CBS 115572]